MEKIIERHQFGVDSTVNNLTEMKNLLDKFYDQSKRLLDRKLHLLPDDDYLVEFYESVKEDFLSDDSIFLFEVHLESNEEIFPISFVEGNVCVSAYPLELLGGGKMKVLCLDEFEIRSIEVQNILPYDILKIIDLVK